MTIETILATIRDWSILLLALEGLVILTIIYFLTYKIARALGQFLPKVRAFLQAARGWAERANRAVARTATAVRRPFIWLESTSQGLKAAKGAWSAPNLRRR